MKLLLKMLFFIFTMMLFVVGEAKSSTMVNILQKKNSYVGNNPLKFVDPTGMMVDWYLNLYKGQIEHVLGSENLFDQAKIHLAKDDAKIEDIENALTEKGYDFEKDPSVEGGYFVDTREQYQAWKMMQVFSPGNLAAVFGMAGEFGVSKGARAILPALGKGVTKAAKGGVKYSDDLVKSAQKLYPKKAGTTELHHIRPQYLGGPKNGPLAPLDGAYHQVITNEFRMQWPYGKGIPSDAEWLDIMRRVYNKYPLPPGY